jgi:hypothetical protein
MMFGAVIFAAGGIVTVPVNVGEASGAEPLTSEFVSVTAPERPATVLTIDDQAGAELAPVETIAWPDVEPFGFRSWIGLSVAAKDADAKIASVTAERNRFISLFL